MKRLLVANRGEIARRIVRTARELGIATVAVHVEEDAALAAGYGADVRVPLPGRGAAAHLDVEALVGIARAEACDAVHPGYGFLSESAAFARAARQAGLVFVGPSPELLALFGDKHRARELAERSGLPIVPGLAAPASLDDVRRFLAAQPTGGAILLKAVAGGGGRGMRRVAPGDDLEAAFARCRSEAERSFGDGALFAERLVEGARHVEIQLVADADGAVGHLWSRDCSLQRRHQKLVEIAPAPGLSPDLHDRLLAAARALAGAADLRGVGTVEFLVRDGEDEFFFLEVNPRLQVEHTVTEEITGVDLVAVQLGLAEGRSLASLGLAEAPAPRGHAIELRVLAETLSAAGEARPSIEPITRWDWPSGPGVRVDTALRPGLAPSPAFDPLIAKLVVSSPDPDYARLLERLRRVLGECRIEGPATNLDLLRAIAARPELERAALTTSLLEGEAAALVAEAVRIAEAARIAEATAGVAAAARGAEATAGVGRGASVSPGSAASAPARAPQLEPGLEGVHAPLPGTLIELSVAPGERVEAGGALAVLESMKMEHVVSAPGAGTVASIHTEVGAVVAEGALLVALRAEAGPRADRPSDEAPDLDAIRPDLAELQARHALLEDTSRPEAVARRRQRGQRTARENLTALCDPGSFSEYGALAVAAMRRSRPLEELQRRTPADAIITGFGTVNADRFGPERARCAVLVADATVLAGTQGFFHHQKIDRILELAGEAGTPVVFFPEGGGGRPNDTDASDVFVAGLNVTSFHTFARLSGRVPRVSVVSGYCFAGSAAFAGCADVIIATRNASLGMGGPAMIEGGGLGSHAPEEVGPTSVQVPNGVIDVLVEDEPAAVEVARRYLGYFQGPLEDWEAGDPRALRHLVPENRRRVYDVRRVIEALCDTGSVLELRRAWGVGMITALVRIEGRPMGLVANDPMHLGGAIDDAGAEKAARFLRLCDAFGIPILSLCDTPGFMVGPEIEARAQVRKVSRLFVTGASLSVPLFCVILRKGYGLGAQAMAGGSFRAPFEIVAWPTGEIGGMGLEGAVRLGFAKQLEEAPDEAARTALFEKLVSVLYEKGKALNAASQLEFDAVIDPAETRERIVRGLRAFGPIERGGRAFVDTW